MTTPTTACEQRDIALAEIMESPTNPRKRYDDQDIAGLAESIKSQGLLQRLGVRRRSLAEAGPPFELVFGHRRYRALAVAGFDTAPCDVREMTDREVREAQLSENSQRKDVSALDEAWAYHGLVEVGVSLEEVAASIGRSKEYVRVRFELTRLPEALQPLVDAGRMTFGAVAMLAHVPPVMREEVLGAMVDEEVRERAEWERLPVFSRGTVSDRVTRAMRLLSRAPWDLDAEGLAPTGRPSCAACPMNSAAQPDLFGEREASCTDRACYEERNVEHWEKVREGWDGPVLESAAGLDRLYGTSLESESGQYEYFDTAKILALPGMGNVQPVLVRYGDRYSKEYDRETVGEALRAAGHDRLAESILRAGSTMSNRDEAKLRKAREAKRTRTAQLVEAIAAGDAPAEQIGEQLLGLFLTGCNQQPLVDAIRRRGWEADFKAAETSNRHQFLKDWVKAATPPEQWGLFAELLCSMGGGYDGENDAHKALRRKVAALAKASGPKESK